MKRLHSGVNPCHFLDKLNWSKLESWGYQPVKISWSYSYSLRRFDTKAYKRVTDGRTRVSTMHGYYSALHYIGLHSTLCWRAVKRLDGPTQGQAYLQTKCNRESPLYMAYSPDSAFNGRIAYNNFRVSVNLSNAVYSRVIIPQQNQLEGFSTTDRLPYNLLNALICV